MELRIFTEPQQGASYDELLRVALESERLGFDGFFRSDHYLKMGAVSGLPGPSDAWITLAGLARDTSRIRLGTLMTSATFRLPGPLAISVAQVDAMSGGRIELGIGAGWFDAEHSAYAIPFPSTKERFDRLEEQLTIITGLWATPLGDTFDFDGAHYHLSDSPALPKPVQQPHPPLIIGGGGKKRTPQLAATFAQEFNMPFSSVLDTTEQFERVSTACAAIDRAHDIVLSAAQVLCVGEDEQALSRRAAVIGREVDELRDSGLAGTVEQVIDKIERFAEIGATRLYLQVLDLSDLDQLALVAERVVPALD